MNNTPELKIYHANEDGSGSAIRLTLSPAVVVGDGETIEGYISLKMVKQLKSGSWPRFDFDAVSPNLLYFDEVSRLYLVLDGQQNSINDGAGLTFQDGSDRIRITAHRTPEVPENGVTLICRTDHADGNWDEVYFRLTQAETAGLKCAIGGALTFLTFGYPRNT